jgi:hypothetical protein
MRMDRMNKLSQKILELPLHLRAEMALRDAFEGVLDEYARNGMPLHTLRDGHVVEISVEEAREMLRTQADPRDLQGC